MAAAVPVVRLRRPRFTGPGAGGRQRATSASNSSSGNSRMNCSTPSTRYSIAVMAGSFRVRVGGDVLSPKHPLPLDALPLEVGGDAPHMPRATTEEGGSL